MGNCNFEVQFHFLFHVVVLYCRQLCCSPCDSIYESHHQHKQGTRNNIDESRPVSDNTKHSVSYVCKLIQLFCLLKLSTLLIVLKDKCVVVVTDNRNSEIKSNCDKRHKHNRQLAEHCKYSLLNASLVTFNRAQETPGVKKAVERLQVNIKGKHLHYLKLLLCPILQNYPQTRCARPNHN